MYHLILVVLLLTQPIRMPPSLYPSLSRTTARDAAGAPPSATERTLYKLEDDWTRGLVRRDASVFRRLVAPGYVYSDESGISTRDQIIAQMTAGTDTVTMAANEGMRAHVYGATAVVTGILVTRGHGTAGPFQHRYRYTDTWIRRDGRWVCIASQDYDMPKAG